MKFRAKYSHTGYSYIGSNEIVSFLIDNIELSNLTKVISQAILSELAANGFSLIPESGKYYALAVRV